ncbi:MAG TPA: hypothetical protein VGQ53_07820 [Chitinophagaceae bacterium]|jgi:hypothetical protein|nr:hypothetical protein [Chitinophagaceae bacterium]
MDGIKSAARKDDAVTFNHYIPAVCILIGLYDVMIPVVPKAMELVTFVSPHFVKMPSFIPRHSAVMISPSA